MDFYWERLGQGGDPNAQQCGWLKDRYGVSWQIVPSVLAEMLSGSVSPATERVMKALLPMKKIDVGALERAFAGR